MTVSTLGGGSPTSLVAAALAAVRADARRDDPVVEAQVAALETALHLIEAGVDEVPGRHAERMERLRGALGSARAAVVAAGAAVVRGGDRARRAA